MPGYGWYDSSLSMDVDVMMMDEVEALIRVGQYWAVTCLTF